MADELPTYQFPTRATSGVLFGMSAARLGAVGLAGIVFIVVAATPSTGALLLGTAAIGGLLAATAIRVGGRPAIDWVPVWIHHGWAMATRNNEFYASPDLGQELPDVVLDLPGELFGIELHAFAPDPADTEHDAPGFAFGILRDTFRNRAIAVAEVSGDQFLFLDPHDQQARVAAWGATLDHVAQTLPDVARLQVVHLVDDAPPRPGHDASSGPAGDPATSYGDVQRAAQGLAHHHRVLVAVALDCQQARRPIRQAGGGPAGTGRVLMDRAAIIDESLRGAGLDVHGWLQARDIADVLRHAFDPFAPRPDANDDGCDPAACGPWGMADQWAAVRHDSGWSTTLQVVRPPARPVTPDFLQHLLVGVPARRRMSMLLVPTPMAIAERRAQTQQVTSESEQALRARLGFGTSARQRRDHDDASRREEDLVDGRAVYRVVWMITVTAPTPLALEDAVGHVESAARRCGVELRRMAGTQRQAASFTLPMCRGAR